MNNKVVCESEWIAARKELLTKEKEFVQKREELTKLRGQLPWHRIEKDYLFDAADGTKKLADLFGSHSQLLVYHFLDIVPKGRDENDLSNGMIHWVERHDQYDS